MSHPDANFIVWRRGLRGPVASLDHLNPRSMMDKDLIEQTLISVRPLTDDDRKLTFAQIVDLYPCPEQSE